ncbi:MAG: hypothetical protein LBM41_05700 [Ruminococcus sp.]|jgi:hypothetical protein|nr:hypothetical protein [Ruminococcus sp.]
MKQWNLLSIKRIPMDIEVKVTPWKFEKVQAEASQAQKPRSADNTPAPLPVINDFSVHDSFDFGAYSPSAELYSPTTVTGVSNIGQAAGFVDMNLSEDDLVAKIAKNPIRATMASRPIESVSSRMQKAPSSQIKNVINWSNGNSNYSFEANGSDFTEIKTASEWNFVPHSVEVVIKQMPGVEIEYIGSPLYFPRSADPNYVPPEEM